MSQYTNTSSLIRNEVFSWKSVIDRVGSAQTPFIETFEWPKTAHFQMKWLCDLYQIESILFGS
jgi:hypothetical protein